MKEKMGHLAVRAEVFILIILCVRVGGEICRTVPE